MYMSSEKTDSNVKEYKKNILSLNPLIYTIDDFLSEEECNYFLEKAKNSNMKRGAVNSKDGKNPIQTLRTNSVLWVKHNDNKITLELGNRLAELAEYPLENAEPFQVVHYKPGEKYELHYDSQLDYVHSEKSKGQRMVTTLVYLNDVEQGGTTWFSKFGSFGIHVKPKKGKLLLFHNADKETFKVLPMSQHAGCAPINGEKYAFNLWFRNKSFC